MSHILEASLIESYGKSQATVLAIRYYTAPGVGWGHISKSKMNSFGNDNKTHF